jgi:hypothetical protein
LHYLKSALQALVVERLGLLAQLVCLVGDNGRSPLGSILCLRINSVKVDEDGEILSNCEARYLTGRQNRSTGLMVASRSESAKHPEHMRPVFLALLELKTMSSTLSWFSLPQCYCWHGVFLSLARTSLSSCSLMQDYIISSQVAIEFNHMQID